MDKGQQITAGLTRVAGIINGITNLYVGLQGDLTQKIAAIGGFLDTLAPGAGGIFSAIGGLVGAIFGGSKKPITVDKILDPVKMLPAQASIFSAARPDSFLYRGEGAILGAAGKVVVELRGDAGRIFTAKVVGQTHNELALEGL